MIWFRFPPGVTQISVQQMAFNAEHSDDAGAYFRVPDHFAANILALGMGFTQVARPQGAPEDPVAEPNESAEAIQSLGAQISELQTKLDEANRLKVAAESDRERLADELFNANTKIAELTGQSKPERPTMPGVDVKVRDPNEAALGGTSAGSASAAAAGEVAATLGGKK